MKVLFIVRGKGQNGNISPFIKSQADSLSKQNVVVDFFLVEGNGIKSYIISAKKLRVFLKNNSYNLLHAHYSLCGWTAVLAFSKIPVIVSFMGSDILGEYISLNKISLKSRIVIVLTNILQFFVNSIIAKSNNIQQKLIRKKKSTIIPNGVNTDLFYYNSAIDYKKELALQVEKKHILFLGNPEDFWKNISLAKKSVMGINDSQVELLAPSPISHEQVAKYLNAADVLLVTSFMEGSPNIIKEAMACNCPIVTTDVGDVSWVIGNVQGCYITSFDQNEVIRSIKEALVFSEKCGRTKGSEQIINLGLDSKTIAYKLINLYSQLIK